MDRAGTKGKPAPVGIAVRNGPVTEEMDVDFSASNGKRKSRGSLVKPTYKESESDAEEKPLVSQVFLGT
jgi:hypothetical protein